MAFFKLIGRVFKKVGSLFSRRKKDEASTRLPGERRIGIYGPSNVGKSVFFTMLYKACRQDREFNLSPDDPQTGRQLVNNLNTLRSGEWLPGTVEESELNFKASLRGGSQFPFSTRDYKGETVDLEQESSAKEKLIDYFQDCDAILFMLSPEMIADPRKCEREIMSFQSMINRVTEQGGKGLRIPIGLMITKADAIEGFEQETQSVLVARKTEYLKAKDFKTFVEGVCGQYHVARNIVFQEQVRDILGRLSLFFDFLMTLSMEFQVFFVSSVGHVRQVEEPSGQLVVRPPEDPDGVGIKTPFLWVIETIRRKEKIAAMNGLRRFVFRLAVVVLLFYSIFYGLHLLPHRDALVDMTSQESDVQPTVVEERLASYNDRWVVRNFAFFALPGADASLIPDRAEKLDATYRAHRFVNEELAALAGAEAIRDLASSYGQPEWMRTHEWYGHLHATQATAVDDAVRTRIAIHNLEVASRIRALYERYRGETSVASEEVQQQCNDLQAQMVLDASTRERYEWELGLCERIGLDLRDQELHAQWDRIEEKLELVTNVPREEYVTELLDLTEAFRAAVKESSSPRLLELGEVAANLASLLPYMLAAVASTEEAETQRTLRQLQRQAKGEELDILRRWARRRERDLESGKIEAERASVGQFVQDRLTNAPSLEWTLDPDTEAKLSGVRLTGERAEALARYLANVRALRNEGVELTMRAVQVPPSFAVVARDVTTGEWGRSQAAANFTLKVRWIAGRPMQIGIQRLGAEQSLPCPGTPGSIFKIHDREEAVPCQATTGTQTRVVFEDLDRVLRERLAEPLAKAFPK